MTDRLHMESVIGFAGDFKKSAPVLREGNEVKYAFIGRYASRYRVRMLCRVLGVQRSAYDAWRGPLGKVIEPQELALRGRMKALFAASRGSLGSRTLMNTLNQDGFQMGRERTRGLMKTLNLKVRHKRKYKVTTDSKQRLPVAKNVLNRAFHPRHRTGSGERTSPLCGRSRAGFIWRWSLTCTPAAWWAGRPTGA